MWTGHDQCTGSVTDCVATNGDGSDGSWNGPSGSRTSGPINAQVVYTLSCLGLDGTTINKSVTVNVIPNWIEK
jgi:hypothetical protein